MFRSCQLDRRDARIIQSHVNPFLFMCIGITGQVVALATAWLGAGAGDLVAKVSSAVIYDVVWLGFSLLAIAAILRCLVVQRRRRRKAIHSLVAGRIHYYFTTIWHSPAECGRTDKIGSAHEVPAGEEDLLRIGGLRRPWLAIQVIDSGFTVVLFITMGVVSQYSVDMVGLNNAWLVAWLSTGLGILLWRWLSLVWWGVKINPAGVSVEPLWGGRKFIPWHEGSFCLVSMGLCSTFAIESSTDSVIVRGPRGSMDALAARLGL